MKLLHNESFSVTGRDELAEICRIISAHLKERGVDEMTSEFVGVSVHELAKNGIVHGNKDSEDKQVFVDLHLCEKYVQVEIEDEGEGFTPANVGDPTNFARLQNQLDNNQVSQYTHGRGIWLVKNYMDELFYNEKGNKVTFKKKLL